LPTNGFRQDEEPWEVMPRVQSEAYLRRTRSKGERTPKIMFNNSFLELFYFQLKTKTISINSFLELFFSNYKDNFN
jgi:hypothetical protein